MPSRRHNDSTLTLPMETSTSLHDVAPPLRQRVLDAAVSSLIERGVAGTTTLEVQRRAGVSRGALLHHFPSHAELLSATVGALVARNEAAVNAAVASMHADLDPLEQAIRALAVMTVQPAFLAEIELWATARVDDALRASLIGTERSARHDSDRVLRLLFASLDGHPAQEVVIAFTTEFLRGLALSGVLHRSPLRRQRLLNHWIKAIRILLAHWK